MFEVRCRVFRPPLRGQVTAIFFLFSKRFTGMLLTYACRTVSPCIIRAHNSEVGSSVRILASLTPIFFFKSKYCDVRMNDVLQEQNYVVDVQGFPGLGSNPSIVSDFFTNVGGIWHAKRLFLTLFLAVRHHQDFFFENSFLNFFPEFFVSRTIAFLSPSLRLPSLLNPPSSIVKLLGLPC